MGKCPFGSFFKLKAVTNKPSSHGGWIERSNEEITKLSVKSGTNLEKQLKMIHLTKEDMALAKVLQPIVVEHIDILVDNFYKNIDYNPNLIKLINTHSAVEKLKQTLIDHITEMFKGVIDQEFINKRIIIAHTHVKIGLEPKWYICAFEELLLGLIDIVELKIENRKDLVQSIKVITKILNLEQQLVLEAYEEESMRLRDLENEKVKSEVRTTIGFATSELAALAEETSASIEEMISTIEEITQNASNGTKLSLLAEERAEKGKDQLKKLQFTMNKVQESYYATSNDMKNLEKNSNEIKKIVKIVQDIANQTNLLSLNAAIEAARAGEHGKGFAVVADEVRKLSDQTNQATKDITELIEQTNAQITNIVQSIDQVKLFVKEADSNTLETNKSFEEILFAMINSKTQNNKIEHELELLTQVINEIGNSSMKIASTSDELDQITQSF